MSVGVVRACDDLRGRFGPRLSPCFLCPPPSPAPSAKLISSTISFRVCRLHHNDDGQVVLNSDRLKLPLFSFLCELTLFVCQV